MVKYVVVFTFIMDLSESVSAAMQQQQAANVAQTELSDKVKGLQARVLRGESTGDAVQDFLLGGYGIFGDEARFELLQQFQEAIGSHQGEPILVRHGGYVTDKKGAKEEIAIIGENANENNLDNHGGSIYVQTGMHLDRGHSQINPRKDVWHVRNSNLMIPGYKLLGVPGPEESDTFTIPSRYTAVFVGKDAVERYFSLKEIVNQQWATKGELVDVKDMPTLDRSNTDLDRGYVVALALLDQVVPKAFAQEHDRRIESDRKSLLENLYRHVALYEHFNIVVRSQCRSHRRGGSSESMKKKGEYENKVKHGLKEAIRIGLFMDSEPFELRPGVKIHTGNYIKGLGKEFHVYFAGAEMDPRFASWGF
ncbi:MAG: hypothetical protein CMH61_00535 [Nanoarchaeota archaeon]|nr:hypothetical protein [Nanoarchaeota archaeon]|tara:strand:+ start:6203 stop:7297 length:1095 start_codon:yes stop_codon:yes gene_type:complete